MLKIQNTKAAILAKSCAPLIMDEIKLPDSLDYGQVLVKILYTGICGSQIGEIDAKKGVDNYLPHLLGHEACAIVVECGPNVKQVTEGDLVVLHWRKGLGIEANPPSYMWQGKKLNAGWITTFSEYSIISENRMTKVNKEYLHTPMLRYLPLMGCAVTTGLGVVSNDAKVRIGESVLIYGAGGVGLNIIQGAQLAGAYPIVAVDVFDNRLELAGQMGATHCINGSQEDAKEKAKQIIYDCGQQKGFDITIDNTGNTDVINTCYTLCHDKGRVVCVGVPKAEDNISIYSLPLHFGKSITGSHGGETVPHEDIPRYLRLVENGKLELGKLITEEYNLEDINVAIERMRNGGLAGRCLIKCGG